MANHDNEIKNTKLIITITCVIALVVLSLARLYQPDFHVDLIVYAIIGGILFGVGGIRELLGSIQIAPPPPPSNQAEKRYTGKKKRKK